MPDSMEHFGLLDGPRHRPRGDDDRSPAPRILPTKFASPFAQPGHLLRTSLLQLMEQAATARVIVIRAAAGFGKTTLLQQFRERCIAAGRVTLWLNLDNADNDVQRLVAHLFAGLCAHVPASGHGATPPGPFSSPSDQQQEVLEWIACCTEPFAILLDEFEAIREPSVLDFIQRLLEALPPSGVLVMASRTTPGIGLGRVRARGQLLEIKPTQLRFSLEEATRFICDKRQLSLREKDIATLYRCTEGWITAIYLASLSLQGRTDPSAFVASFSGSNLELAQYLAEDILARQSEDCRLFLLQTSVLTQLNAPLCNALTGRNDSEAMIQYLDSHNLFLFPVDDQHLWFRYHSLFASFLQDALERYSPGQAQALHRTAAHWYFSQNQPIPAIEHLLLANATAEAASRLAENVAPLLAVGRSRLLLRWLDQIPAHTLQLHPDLSVAYAWALAMHRRYQDAMTIVENLEALAGEDGQRTYRLEARTIRCLVLALTDQVQSCYTVALEHINKLAVDEVFQYRVVANSLAFSMVSCGRYEEARNLLSRAIQRDSRRNGGTYMNMVASSIEGVLDLIQGRLGNALARLQAAAERHWEGKGSHGLVGRLSIEITRSLTLYEVDALDEVADILGETLAHAKVGSPPDALIISHVMLARTAYLNGERDTWLRHLAELEQIGRQSGSNRVVCSTWLERARIATLESRLDAAVQAVRSADLVGEWEQPGILFYGNDVDTPSIARLRLQIAQGECLGASKSLQDGIEQARQHQHHRRALKLRLLLSMALDGLGRQADAFSQLTQALRFASHEGFLRSFLDEGARLAELVQRWAVVHQARASSLGIEPRFVTRLLQRAGSVSQASSALPGEIEAREALTTREIQVIQFLAAGLRNRAIAEKMFLSEFTVKSHLRNINSKLGAQGRTEAVAIARSRGLID